MGEKKHCKQGKCECNHENCEKHEEVVSKEAEYLELAQRLKAEFENYKKRNAEVMTQSFDNGVAHTVAKLLPAIDSFKQAKDTITDENTLKGLDLVINQIFGALEELGVKKIEAVGKIFDPNYHNAVIVGNDASKQDNEILDEFQEGFILKNERVIRHSVVRINKLD